MNVFETKKLRLIVKSPIHIGSVLQRITRLEFIYQGKYIYPVSEDRLSEFLHLKKLIPGYVSAIERDGHRFDLGEFFKKHRVSLTERDLENLSWNRKIRPLTDASGLQEFKPFIRDGFGKPYIPGTSIKGVIRTALLYNALKELKDKQHQRFREIEEKISKDIDSDPKKERKKRLFEWANIKWFESFVLPGNRKDCPNTDWLRMLHVSDAYSTRDIETVLIPANVLKKEKTWTYKIEPSGKYTTIWVECIPENTVFEFEISWDKNLLREFKQFNRKISLPENLDTILNQIKLWANDVFAFEKSFSRSHDLENWYNSSINISNFRIGFGSGMVSTTILMLLNEALRTKVRNYAGLNRRQEIAPKSRRVWVKNNNPVPFGWAAVEFIS